MAPRWPEEETSTLARVPCAPGPVWPAVPPAPPPPVPLTGGGIQPAVLQEVLPHLPTASRGIECRQVSDSRASLRKARASPGANFEGQTQAHTPTRLWDLTLTPSMLPSNANPKLLHLRSCKLHP